MKAVQKMALTMGAMIAGVWGLTEQGFAASTAAMPTPSNTDMLIAVAGVLLTVAAISVYVYRTK